MDELTQVNPRLWTTLKIGNVNIKNRFVLAPMMMTNYFDANGNINKSGEDYYVERATGGFGLLITGAFDAIKKDKIEPNHMSPTPLANPESFIPPIKQMTSRVHLHGSKIFGEITFGQGRVFGQPGPSENPVVGHPDQVSPAMTIDQIHEKIEAVAETAAVLKQAGFDGIDVHGMHWGFVLEQFAAELTNKRTDEYGGSLDNRLRICKEAREAIAKTCGPDYPVTIRFDVESYLAGLNKPTLDTDQEAGISLHQAIEIAKRLEDYGYDALMIDSGAFESLHYGLPPMYIKKGFTIPFAKQIKQAVKIPLIVTGSRIDEPHLLDQAIDPQTADAVAIGRASLADPEFVNKLAAGHFEAIRPCIGCNMCLQTLLANGHLECAVNPLVGHEDEEPLTPTTDPKKVVVVGGGLAGMAAARILKRRGHQVEIYEQSDVLGGDLIAAGDHDFKVDIHRLNDWYKLQMKNLHITVHLNHQITADELVNLHPDVALLATGSQPRMITFPGSDSDKVVDCLTAIEQSAKLGKQVIIVGGGQTGCEIALDLAQHDHEVSIVEMTPAILNGANIPFLNNVALKLLLEKNNVKILTSTRLKAVTDQGAVVTNTDQTDELLPADNVVISAGMVSRQSFASSLIGKGFDVFEIGDGQKVGNVYTVTKSAYEIAKRI